jgi:hypothetical protein
LNKEIVYCDTIIMVKPGTAMTVKEMGPAVATRREFSSLLKFAGFVV